ncbi:hypothetical protein [Actinopolymorpha alba]|uniref:hypothetical protein n=1 Tax=Actinopolymorpha alba TaxID=533267 RepID=UPI00039E9FD2|nr:hypothetical protein [Actinopolymorpha alba]
MSISVIPDLGAAPAAGRRDLARSLGPVSEVDAALTRVCAAACVVPSLLAHPVLGPALSGPRPEVSQGGVDDLGEASPSTSDHRTRTSNPAGDPRAPQSPASRGASVDSDRACPPGHRVRRPAADRSPERPAARAVREDPTCRVGTAQLRALAGELPPKRPVGRGSRAVVPPVGCGTTPGLSATPGLPAMPPMSPMPGRAWSTSALSRRLGFDVDASLRRPPRPGPPAPTDLLAGSAPVARGRIAAEPDVVGAADQHRGAVAAAPSPVVRPPGRKGRRRLGAADGAGERGRPTSREFDERGRVAHPNRRGDAAPAGGGAAPAGGGAAPVRAGAAPVGEGAESVDEGAAPVSGGRVARPEEGRPRPVTSRTTEEARYADPRGIGAWAREGREGTTDARRVPNDAHSGRVDDDRVEAAVERVLRDAARRYGIGV